LGGGNYIFAFELVISFNPPDNPKEKYKLGTGVVVY
jgi:hypothetical protein